MKACEGRIGRVFLIRLEDGDVVPECIERFAEEKSIKVGHVIMVGGVGSGEVVVGPRDSETMPPDPMLLPVDAALASGRPIRKLSDKGAIIFMDSRFKAKYKWITDWIREELEIIPDKSNAIIQNLYSFWKA